MTTQNTEDNWEQDYYELYSGGVAFETVDEVTKQRYIDFKKIGYYFKSLLAKREQEYKEEIIAAIGEGFKNGQLMEYGLARNDLARRYLRGKDLTLIAVKDWKLIPEIIKDFGLAESSGKETDHGKA